MAEFGDAREDPSQMTASAEDAAIRTEILERLAEHFQVHTDRIEVMVCHGEVKLGGIAVNRFAKRRAEELAHDVEGVRSVRNEIHIQPDDQEGGPILTTHLPGVDHGSSNSRS
jgi:osmotically-inducible protein OsmY